MIKEEKNEEMTRQMEQIWRERHDPELQAKRRAKQKREKNLEEKTQDLGLT